MTPPKRTKREKFERRIVLMVAVPCTIHDETWGGDDVAGEVAIMVDDLLSQLDQRRKAQTPDKAKRAYDLVPDSTVWTLDTFCADVADATVLGMQRRVLTS